MRFRTNILATSLLMFSALLSSVSFAFANPDEGMYTPDQISRLPLAKRGLKLKPSEIYNPNGGGLSDAIIRLSVGCTAEFVSPDGLILTNHHCGFDALVSASTPEKDYVEMGFKANSRAEEMSAKGYSIFMTQRVEDVTAKINRGTESLTGEAVAQAVKKNTDELQQAEQAKAPKGSTVRIQSLNNGFFHYLYQTMQVKDVRVVYAPPRSIGVFGGDPDNFEWSRHTGDFTFLRAYTAPDGTSAEYSASNVPMKPKRFLTMNIGGVKENDFVFVMGHPGGTTRYRESQAIDYAQKVNFPFLASYLRSWSDTLKEIGQDDEEKRIKFQSDIASLDNGRKLYEGGEAVLKRVDATNKRRAEEAKFTAWVNANPVRKAKYGTLLNDFSIVYKNNYATPLRDRLVRTFPNPSMPVFKQVQDAVQAVMERKPLTAEKRAEIVEAYKTREPVLERELIKYFLKSLADLPANEKFTPAENLLTRFQGKERRKAEETLAESIAEKDFTTPETVFALYEMTPAQLKEKYPNVSDLMNALVVEKLNVTSRTQNFNAESGRLRRLYIEGMSEMKGTKPYPDANSTLRFTYGNVRGYKPREAVTYSPFTTLKGVIEKDTGVNPFDVPQKLKDLQRTRDFGRFGAGDTVPVNFLATTDIIGGNSGSPIMNGAGEQVGLVFDGNYEGLGNDIYYDDNYGRTIAVDIRYVLFVTEKFGGAGWILNEMRIKGGGAAKAMRTGM